MQIQRIVSNFWRIYSRFQNLKMTSIRYATWRRVDPWQVTFRGTVHNRYLTIKCVDYHLILLFSELLVLCSELLVQVHLVLCSELLVYVHLVQVPINPVLDANHINHIKYNQSNILINIILLNKLFTCMSSSLF
jgi:hypothetical protein